MLATSSHCAAPGVNGLALSHLKRKRSDSSDSATGQNAPVATKLRAGDAPQIPVVVQSSSSANVNCDATATAQNPASSNDNQPDPPAPQDPTPSDDATGENQEKKTGKVNVDQIRETLEAQLSLEVLLKHNELRLIDQEIAKCQVALEQLRRCAEIPYPGTPATGLSQSVSNGMGMAVLAPGNGPAPLSPAPWGVTDGPYTRHYSKWLLPDPRFDGGEYEPATPSVPSAAAATPVEGRSTRGNSGDGGFMANKSRPHRGSTASKLQSLPTGYPAPKEKAGPMIIRRKSDNVLVKLVCLDCRRDNFSSTQGFINHCRIAHSRNFASHDAAAVASGEPVEVDDAGAVIGGKSETPTSASTPGYVHPLVRSAHAIEPSKTPSSASEPVSDNATPRRRSHARQASFAVETPRSALGKQTTPSTAGPFMGSPATPHLSSLMQQRGVGLDLERLVGDAKTTVDLGAYSSDEGESDAEPDAASTKISHGQKPLQGGVGRQPMRTTVSQTASHRPNSRKGLDHLSHDSHSIESLTPSRPPQYQSPYGPASSAQVDGLREVDGMDGAANLSPNTVESNQAPSLVSDDDDYEAASDSDSPGPSSSEAGDHEEEFSHIDVEDDEDTTTSTTATDPKADPGMASGAGHPSAPLSKSLGRSNARDKDRFVSPSIVPMNRNKDEKRVSFASPDGSPAKEKNNNNNNNNNHHQRKPEGGQ